MPYWDKQKKTWIAQVYHQGKKYRSFQSTKTRAKAWEIQKKKEFNYQSHSTNILSLLEFATNYLDYSRLKHSRKTYSEKRSVFRNFFASVNPQLSVSELHKGTVLDYLQEQAKNRSGNAANKDRKNLVAAWNWATQYIPDFPSKNPFLVDRFPEIRSPRYIPPEKDFWKVYQCAETFQDSVMILSFLHLAARRNEIFNLRRDDIDFVKNQVRLCTRKRKDGSYEYDWLPLTDRLNLEFSKILAYHDNEWCFPNPRTGIPYFERGKWFPRLCHLAQVKPFGIHSIRHLSASILIQNDIPLVDVQTILRHKKLATTERYIHRLVSVRKSMEVFK